MGKFNWENLITTPTTRTKRFKQKKYKPSTILRIYFLIFVMLESFIRIPVLFQCLNVSLSRHVCSGQDQTGTGGKYMSTWSIRLWTDSWRYSVREMDLLCQKWQWETSSFTNKVKVSTSLASRLPNDWPSPNHTIRPEYSRGIFRGEEWVILDAYPIYVPFPLNSIVYLNLTISRLWLQ